MGIYRKEPPNWKEGHKYIYAGTALRTRNKTSDEVIPERLHKRKE